MIDILNKHFQDTLRINKEESGLVQAANYLAYFLMAIPAGLIAKKLGYKGGILVGLSLIASGAFWFIPATRIGTYWAFLLGLFVIGAGMTCLETIANPYATVLGPPETGATRINIAQTFNGVGWILGPIVGGGYFVFSARSTRQLRNFYTVPGPAFLINPVTSEGMTQREVYLPAGVEWVNFWTGKRMSGGQTITAEAPIDRIPIYGRAGSIVPIGPRAESAAAKADPIEIRIYPGANGDFNLYEDGGDNYDYEHGAYSVITFHWDEKSRRLAIGDRHGSFAGMLEHRTFHAVIVREGHGAGITPSLEPDVTIEYQGNARSVQVLAAARN